MQSACSSLLLGARAHVSRCVTWAGKMALEYAAEMGETELLRLLDPTGANGGAVPAARREANPTRSESVDLAASTSRRFHSTPSRPRRSRGWMRTSRPPSSSAPSTAGCAARCLSFPNLAKSRQASGHQGGPADFYIVVEGALATWWSRERSNASTWWSRERSLHGGRGSARMLLHSGRGSARMFRGGRGCRRRVAEYGPGATFGKLALLYSCPCKASVIARTECVLHATEPRCLSRVRAPKVLASAHAL